MKKTTNGGFWRPAFSIIRKIQGDYCCEERYTYMSFPIWRGLGISVLEEKTGARTVKDYAESHVAKISSFI
jgi:hypothetical protein